MTTETPYKFGDPNPYSLAVGDEVVITSWGGEIRLWMTENVHQTSTVVRINRSGFPVISIDDPSRGDVVEVTDRYGSAHRSDQFDLRHRSFVAEHGVDF